MKVTVIKFKGQYVNKMEFINEYGFFYDTKDCKIFKENTSRKILDDFNISFCNFEEKDRIKEILRKGYNSNLINIYSFEM